MNKKRLSLILLLVLGCLNLIAQDKQFSKDQIIADLNYLKLELETHHPNLYIYSSKTEMDDWFESRMANLSNTINGREAYRIITSISDKLKDGHSYIYVSDQYLDRFFNSELLFPLDVFWTNDSLVVIGNYSKEQNIPSGAILTKINGVDVRNIKSEIVQHTSRDGDNLQYPNFLFYNFFSAYYSSFYGFHSIFDIQFLDEQGQVKEATVKGTTRKEIQAKRTIKTDRDISLQIIPNRKSAILSIKSFDNKVLKKEAQQKFKKEIKTIFKTIATSDIQHLAIDLRDNQGGALRNGIFLLQHVLNTDFSLIQSFYTLKNGKHKQINTNLDNYFKPRKTNHFDGDVFLFTNGGSFSCSAMVANAFKNSNRGTLIGQMTGGSAYTNSGGSNRLITLPNTKIKFTIPKTQFNLQKPTSTIGLGVRPDIEIPDHPSRITSDEDHVVLKFLELTKE